MLTRGQLIAIVILVLLIMFAPVFLANGVERFIDGLSVMWNRWT